MVGNGCDGYGYSTPAPGRAGLDLTTIHRVHVSRTIGRGVINEQDEATKNVATREARLQTGRVVYARGGAESER